MKDPNQEAILYQNTLKIITFFVRIHLLRHKRHIAENVFISENDEQFSPF